MIWTVLLFVILFWSLIVKYVSRRYGPGYQFISSVSQICASPDCLRCSSYLKSVYSKEVGKKLNVLYSKYDSLVVHKLEDRLTFDVSCLPLTRQPTVCFLKDMCDEPWHNHKQKYLQDIFTDAYPTIKTELAGTMFQESLWSVNSDNSGTWRKLFLYNQGKKVTRNCQEMPRTTHLIENMDTFMCGVVFGNAFVSLLDAHSTIPVHCGPTNLRARCHVALQIPSGDCSLTVAGKQEHWTLKDCLLFDDSFLHTANNNTDSPRIVLVVDLWHPNLTYTEIKIMSELFAVKEYSPDMNRTEETDRHVNRN